MRIPTDAVERRLQSGIDDLRVEVCELLDDAVLIEDQEREEESRPPPRAERGHGCVLTEAITVFVTSSASAIDTCDVLSGTAAADAAAYGSSMTVRLAVPVWFIAVGAACSPV
jgi:hypothetical protein